MWPWGACWLRDQACQENVWAFEGFEACNAWRMAGWTAHKKPLMWPWGRPARLGVPRSFCRVLKILRVLAVFGFKGFKGLRAGKRQAWTPIRSLWCGLGVPVGCGIRHAKRMFKQGFEACNAWRMAGWTAHKKPLMWPWGSFCLRGWAFPEAFAEFSGF